MLDSRIKRMLLAIIRWGNYLILLTPVFVYSPVLYPFVFSKIIFFRVIVEIMLVAWVILMLYEKDYHPKLKNPLIYCLGIFLLTLIITTITGVDPDRSFWSNQERMTGVFTMLHFGCWFLILASTMKEGKDWEKMLWVTLGCSVLIGLYGFGQRLGLQFLLPASDANRMSSTLGNPIFLSAYAMLNVFLGVILFLRSKSKWAKTLTTIAVVFNTIMMLLTVTRGVILSFLVVIFILIIFIIIKKLSPKTKTWATIIIILLLLAAVGGYIYFQTSAAQPLKNELPYYLTRFLDFKALTGNLDQRTIPWQIAWQGFKDRPIFGWGWENYNVVFNQYYQPKILSWGLEGSWFDHSHNQIMDLLSTTGALGALAYLFFYGNVFYLLIKKMKKEDSLANKLPFLIIILMFAAYFLQNLTVFDTPAPLIIFYFSLGLVYLYTNDSSDIDNDKRTTTEKKTVWPLAILIIIILLVFIYQFNFKPLIQSKNAATGFSVASQDLKQGLWWYQRSLAEPTFASPEIRSKLFQTIIASKSTNDPDFQSALSLASTEMAKSCQEHPHDARYWLLLGQLYDLDKNNLTPGQAALKNALSLSPQRQQIYFELAQNEFLQKKLGGAVQYAQEAINLAPQIGLSYYQRGLIHFKIKEYQKAIDDLEMADQLGYNHYDLDSLASPFLYLSSAQAQLGKYDQAIATISDGINRLPNNIQLIIQKIMIYKMTNNWSQIEAFVEQIRATNPGLADQLQSRLNEPQNN
jgi:O-antigen ligase/tetratricopeptide (TPR) repeat protein